MPCLAPPPRTRVHAAMRMKQQSMTMLYRIPTESQIGMHLDGTGTDSSDLEADLDQSFSVKDQSTVKDKGGLVHRVVDLLPVQSLKFVPFSSDDDSVGTQTSVQGRVGDLDVLLNRFGGDLSVVGQVKHDRRLGDFRVVDADVSSLGSEVVHQGDGGGFSGVSGVLLEGETEDGDSLAGDGVEHGVNNLLGESVFLVLVHLDYGVPVLGNGGQVKRFGKVDQVQDIL